MTRLSSLQVAAHANLHGALGQLHSASLRLATLRRINTASDNPADLIAAAQLVDQLALLSANDRDATRVEALASVADSGLAHVGDLLTRLEGNLSAAAGGLLGEDELAALQIENDAVLEAIDRIAEYTRFGARRLLDGSFEPYALARDTRFDAAALLRLPNVRTTHLVTSAGRLADLASGGSLRLSSGRLAPAAEVLRAARSQVLEARASVGAFARATVGTYRELIATEQTNLTIALGQLLDADLASETSQLIRARLLAQTSLGALQLIADRRGTLIHLAQMLD